VKGVFEVKVFNLKIIKNQIFHAYKDNGFWHIGQNSFFIC